MYISDRELHRRIVDLLTLEDIPEPTFTEEQFNCHYRLIGFAEPYVFVKRLSDGMVGTMLYKDKPRVYFCFEPDRDI